MCYEFNYVMSGFDKNVYSLPVSFWKLLGCKMQFVWYIWNLCLITLCGIIHQVRIIAVHYALKVSRSVICHFDSGSSILKSADKTSRSVTKTFCVLCIGFLLHKHLIFENNKKVFNPYPMAFPYGNGMVLHFYQQQESSTTKTVHKVINKGLKTYV